MKVAKAGQREQVIKAGNVRPGAITFLRTSSEADAALARAKSQAQAIAARRKEMRK